MAQDASTALKAMPPAADQTVRLGIAAGEKQGSPQDSLDKQKTSIQQMSDALDQLRAKATSNPTDDLEKQIVKLGFELEAAKEKAKGFKNAIQGGSDRQLQQAVAARASALGKISERDQLAQDIQADKDSLATATLSASERESITNEMYQRIKQLRETDAADAKSKADLQAAQAARGSDAEYAARAAGIRATMAVQNQGNAAYIQGQTELTNLTRQQADQRAELARYVEGQQTQAALQGIEQRMQAVKTEAQEGRISGQEELQQLLALQAQKTAVERADLEFKLSSYKDDANAYARTQADIVALTQKSATEQQAIIDQVNKQMEASYRSAFQQVGSTVSGQLMQMIEGTSRFRDLTRAVVLDIIQQWISSRIKILADNAASVAQQTAQVVTGQAAQTQAVATSAAAQSAAKATGVSAGLAAQAMAAIKSIGTSAAQTYGAVFAYMSPFMGPLAAAPAAAASAAVLAEKTLIGLDSGTWNLPGDMIAQVHQGEMVVPSFESGLFRDVISQMGGGGGGGGGNVSFGDIHVHNPRNADDFIRQLASPTTQRKIRRSLLTMRPAL